MSEPHTSAHGGPGHEVRDVDYYPIVMSAIGLTIVVIVAFIAMLLLFDQLAARESRLSPPPNPLAADVPRQPPAPRLQAVPIQDLREFRAAQEAMLGSYGWVDRDAGVVRIPIERAIELLAERPLPHREAPEEIR